MIGRISGLALPVHDAVHAGVDEAEGAQHQVVHAGDALAGHHDGGLRKEDVVVDQGRAVPHLDEHVRVEHGAPGLSDPLRAVVVVHQVLGDPRALGLPVAPHAHDAMVDMVAADRHVDGRVELDPGGLRAAQLLGVADVVDVAVLDQGEHAAHPAHDTGLLTVVDVAAADDMVAHVLLQPAVVLPPANGVPLHLGGALHVPGGEIHVVFRIAVLSEGDPAAAAVGDLAVLDDPATAPVRPDHAVLIRGGGGPGGGRLGNLKAADRDVVYAGFVRQEAVAAHADLHLLPVGIETAEVRKEDRPAVLLPGEPFVPGLLRLPGAGVRLAGETLLQGHGLVHHAIVQEHGARVPDSRREVPVSVDIGRVGIVVPEHAVVHLGRPDVLVISRPSGEELRPRDHGAQRRLRSVDDGRLLRPGSKRIDVLPVHARHHHDLVPRERQPRRILDVAEGPLPASVPLGRGVDVHIVDRCFSHSTNLSSLNLFTRRSFGPWRPECRLGDGKRC